MPTKSSERPETKGRKTLYKGIEMRSRLEADYASHLDRAGAPWEYEPVCFAGDGMQWLPDFQTGNLGSILVELKPAAMLAEIGRERNLIERVDALLTRMSVAWLSEPDASLSLIFWTFGASELDFGIVGTKNIPWRTYGPGPLTMLWPGMGQFDALPVASESAAARRATSAR